MRHELHAIDDDELAIADNRELILDALKGNGVLPTFTVAHCILLNTEDERLVLIETDDPDVERDFIAVDIPHEGNPLEGIVSKIYLTLNIESLVIGAIQSRTPHPNYRNDDYIVTLVMSVSYDEGSTFVLDPDIFEDALWQPNHAITPQ